MPNFQTPHLKTLSFPCKEGESNFLWEAVCGSERLIFVNHESQDFFIKIVKKQKKYLVKNDKISRPSTVSFLQKALQNFQSICDAKATFSNIHTQKNRQKKSEDFLKPLEYFASRLEDKREIWIEVGFGSGRHLLYQAKENPNILHIGIEIHKPSIEQVTKLAKTESLDNLYLVDYDARILMEFLPSNRVGRIFVHFPIPWDKKPHRRVISKDFIKEALRVLKVGGKLELRTDSELYYSYASTLFMGLSRAKISINKNIDAPISSKYEDRWRKMKKNIYDITLYNDLFSDEIALPKPLIFKDDIEVSNLREKMEKTILRGDDWFVNIEDWYEIDLNKAMLKISIGAYDRPEHRYVILENKKAKYFPKPLFSTKSSKKAHEALCEWIKR